MGLLRKHTHTHREKEREREKDVDVVGILMVLDGQIFFFKRWLVLQFLVLQERCMGIGLLQPFILLLLSLYYAVLENL